MKPHFIITRYLLLIPLLLLFFTNRGLSQESQENFLVLYKLKKNKPGQVLIKVMVSDLAKFYAYDLVLQYQLPESQEWANTSVKFEKIRRGEVEFSKKTWFLNSNERKITPLAQTGKLILRLFPVFGYKKLRKTDFPKTTALIAGGSLLTSFIFSRIANGTYGKYDSQNSAADAENVRKRANKQVRRARFFRFVGVTLVAYGIYQYITTKKLRKKQNFFGSRLRFDVGYNAQTNNPQYSLKLRF